MKTRALIIFGSLLLVLRLMRSTARCVRESFSEDMKTKPSSKHETTNPKSTRDTAHAQFLKKNFNNQKLIEVSSVHVSIFCPPPNRLEEQQ